MGEFIPYSREYVFFIKLHNLCRAQPPGWDGYRCDGKYGHEQRGESHNFTYQPIRVMREWLRDENLRKGVDNDHR